MIRHIVCWKFLPGTESQQELFFSRLAALQGVIPELIASEIHRNVGNENNFDACLIADFNDLDALERYKTDPRHQAVSSLCKTIRSQRTCIDFLL